MNWFWLAIFGHLANGASFIVDKILLQTAFRRSATYAALMGSLSILALFAFPWVKEWPPSELWLSILGFGGVFVLALWAFFEALRRSEASRIVPIVGSLIPLVTLVGARVFLGESLTPGQAGGFALLVFATLVLSLKENKSFSGSIAPYGFACLAAILFSLSTVFGKYAYERADFAGVFVSSRVVAGMTGILLGLCYPRVRQEWAELTRVNGQKQKKRLIWAVGGQLIGVVGFVAVHLALSQGNIALVNALQAVQYAFLVLVAWFGGAQVRAVLQEKVTSATIALKSVALFCVAMGLYLLA